MLWQNSIVVMNNEQSHAKEIFVFFPSFTAYLSFFCPILCLISFIHPYISMFPSLPLSVICMSCPPVSLPVFLSFSCLPPPPLSPLSGCYSTVSSLMAAVTYQHEQLQFPFSLLVSLTPCLPLVQTCSTLQKSKWFDLLFQLIKLVSRCFKSYLTALADSFTIFK